MAISIKEVFRPHMLVYLAIACLSAVTVRAEITLNGLDKTQQVNVRAYLGLASASCESADWQLRRMTADAAQQVTMALEALGHYRATVQIKDGKAKDTCWHKVVDVTPGPVTTYQRANVAVTGDATDDPVLSKLATAPTLQPGAVVHHGRYRQVKQALINKATERGYFDAQFTRSEILVSEDKATAVVDLVLDSGPRYRFGVVTIDSELLTNELMNLLNDIDEDDWFDARKIAATHRNFLDSGYFGFVNVDADPRKAQALHVPVNIELSPAKSRVYTGGLGFATDVGPRFRLNYRNRRINQRGHTLDGQLLASPVQSIIGAEYRIPIGDDRRDVFALSSSYEDQDTDTSDFRSIEVGARRTVALENGWLNTASIELRREDFVVGNQSSVSTLLIPGMSWWTGTEAIAARPDNAWRMSLDVRGTTTAIGSDTSFVQVEARGRIIRSLTERTRVLGRLTVGATAKEQRDELPPSLRFFAGGDTSVRGYAYESIGPVNDENVVIGGGKLISASVELDWQLNTSWAFAVFADAGSAFNDGGPDLKTSVGVGVRRLTPVGPLRFDLAAPLDRERKVRLHFSIGSDL